MPPLMPQKRADFFNFSPQQLTELLSDWNEPAFRASQTIAAAWTPGAVRFAEATSLPQALRARLDATFVLPRPLKPKTVRTAADGTVKALFEFADGACVESVGIPHQDRLTFCLSTQCGCALGCAFCATARLGFRRNLVPGEIIGQIRGLSALLQRTPTNLVLMGMGEPLQNLEAVRNVLAQITHPKAMNWSPRKTTVSTSGWLPGIQAITRDPIPAKLAFSLNAARNDLRDRLMPVNRRWPLAEVLAALREYARATGQAVTVEYVLLGGVNDGPEDARLLVRLLRNLPCKINLIPWNPSPESTFRPPAPAAVDAFLRELRRGRTLVTFRESRGAEIGAACGQLAARAQRRAA